MSKVRKFITKDSGKRIKFKSGFNRDVQEGKPRYDLIPPELLKRLADLYARGAVKYGDDNWKKATTPEEINRFKASAFRHFMDWISDSNKEEDHAVATIWNIISYEWHTNHKLNAKKKS
ncbi:MAG TPA: DUF5664 domain-containing protein [Candidatus Pelethenecus sp.]|nr:DUF5664 domain-containing protein [Candidatus Pelethenecus sp.]